MLCSLEVEPDAIGNHDLAIDNDEAPSCVVE